MANISRYDPFGDVFDDLLKRAVATLPTTKKLILLVDGLDESQRYAATAWHSLIRINEKLLIKMKRVEILNCDAALPSIQLFL